MIDTDHLNKITRIAETVRALAAQIQREERRYIHSYKKEYEIQYNLVKPILYQNMDYQLEFQGRQKPESLSYTEIKPALTSLSTFLDSIVKQETLGNRQQQNDFTKEYFIEDHKPFAAYIQITNIVNQAVNSLKIIDNYAESQTLDFFLAVNTQVDIRVITMKCQPNEIAFKTALGKFVSQWGGKKFEVRLSSYFHDRFIIVDDIQVWHLGPSLNRLGIKPMMISMIRDQDIQKKILEVFEGQWTIASKI